MGISLQMGWSAEPLTRAGERFEELWKFLEGRQIADWQNVHQFATYFHPDYIIDQKTRALRERPVLGLFVYRQMEKGEFSLKTVATLLPSMRERFSPRVRGTPLEYREMTLTVAACLACHEIERIDAALEESPNDPEKIARHLYWFERFAALWDRTRTAIPPSLNLTKQKRAKANAWQEELRKSHADYLRRNPKANMRRVVASFVKGGVNGSGFRGKYDWARKNLK